LLDAMSGAVVVWK